MESKDVLPSQLRPKSPKILLTRQMMFDFLGKLMSECKEAYLAFER